MFLIFVTYCYYDIAIFDFGIYSRFYTLDTLPVTETTTSEV